MKFFFICLCSALSLVPGVHANTLFFTNTAQKDFSFNATATYSVDSNGNGIASQGFVGPAYSQDPNTLTLVADYSAVAGNTILDAMLNLSQVLSSGNLSTSRTLSSHGSHSLGAEPVFSASATGLFVNISGLLSGAQTLNLSGTTNYDLLPFFQKDIAAGNSLTIQLTMGDTFSATVPALSKEDHKWKNETATYILTQQVSGTFDVSTQVHYQEPILDTNAAATPTPEPLSLVLSGGGLITLGLLRRKRQKR